MISFLVLNLFISTGFGQVRGTDDREVLQQYTSVQERSYGAITNGEPINVGGTGRNFTIRGGAFGPYQGMCEGENLADANFIRDAVCSGTYVGDGLFLTAFHCLDRDPSGAARCPLDFLALSGVASRGVGSSYRSTDVGSNCMEVLASGDYASGSAGDWALIRVNNMPTTATSAPLAPPGLPQVGVRVSTIGTPQGIPGVRSSGAIVYTDQEGRGVTTDMDVVGGNSGGGVFNERGELIGVLVTSYGAQRIYSYEPSGCARWTVEPDFQEHHDGEWVTGAGFIPIDYFRDQISPHINPQAVPSMEEESSPRGRRRRSLENQNNEEGLPIAN